MNKLRIATSLCTLGSIGYFGAPGTVATIVTLPLVYVTHALIPEQRLYLGFLICLFPLCMYLVRIALTTFKRQHDPSEIVLDELFGCLLTFWSIELTPQSVLVGFILFRVFDIIKFGWVKKAELLADAWGVMGDDIVAAALANVMLRLMF